MYLTVHILRSLPLHNLNRDQNGLPKSQFDGGVQRARLSAQSLKRPARIGFLNAVRGIAPGSYRTKQAADIVNQIAARYAAELDMPYDPAAGRKTAQQVVGAIFKNDDKAKDSDDSPKDTLLLFSEAELETLAVAIVDGQQTGAEVGPTDFIQDHRSASLDIAAFGRMFAQRDDLSTQAAVAVSHAVTTHPMTLTVDYFTAVDETPPELRPRDDDGSFKNGAGAAHLGLTFYTSGVYYSSFTIDTDQLRRSWSGIHGDTAPAQLAALVRSLISALPTGRLTNSNAHTIPFLVLAEPQNARHAYEFETPVEPGRDGGYKESSVRALAAQRQMALRFDPDGMGDASVWGDLYGNDFAAAEVDTLDKLIEFVTGHVIAATAKV